MCSCRRVPICTVLPRYNIVQTHYKNLGTLLLTDLYRSLQIYTDLYRIVPFLGS